VASDSWMGFGLRFLFYGLLLSVGSRRSRIICRNCHYIKGTTRFKAYPHDILNLARVLYVVTSCWFKRICIRSLVTMYFMNFVFQDDALCVRNRVVHIKREMDVKMFCNPYPASRNKIFFVDF
jgi:hypothetical protein